MISVKFCPLWRVVNNEANDYSAARSGGGNCFPPKSNWMQAASNSPPVAGPDLMKLWNYCLGRIRLLSAYMNRCRKMQQTADWKKIQFLSYFAILMVKCSGISLTTIQNTMHWMQSKQYLDCSNRIAIIIFLRRVQWKIQKTAFEIMGDCCCAAVMSMHKSN